MSDGSKGSTGYEQKKDNIDKPSILCVDDEVYILNALRRQLRSLGDIHIEESCLSALELVKSQSFDIIITDMKLPNMSGAEFLAEVKALELDDVPECLLITGYSDSDSLESAINTGIVQRFLNKPWKQNELIVAVQDLLQKRKLKQKNRKLSLELHERNQQLNGTNKRLARAQILVDKYVLSANINAAGRISHVSTAFSELIGLSSYELVGYDHKVLCEQDTSPDVLRNMYSTLMEGNAWSGEIIARSKDNAMLYLDASIEPEFDGRDKLIGFTGFYQDITDKKRIELLSMTDQLTKIPNRRKLELELERELSRANRYKNSLTLIVIDIDLFKQVNDTYGHQVGDMVLISVAKLIADNIRRSDIIARWGGEEFIIMSTQTALAGALKLAEKVRRLLAAYKMDVVGTITASFGVAEYRQNESAESFFKRADTLLYKAKKAGRNRVEGE
ncbi:diguanylate cyclase [Alteromonas sp. A081]|uniref:GGDEF domain-containing response regulator n=1 Tax=Alteromonas sp. A081 TaxID=3410269 RepID=UPI003B98449B